MPPPTSDVESVVHHPLAAWVEEAFGLTTEGGRLVRRPPETFANAAERLTQDTGLDKEFCAERLRAVLDAGNEARLHSAQPVFTFRLHQFLSPGSSVRATLDPLECRHLTVESHRQWGFLSKAKTLQGHGPLVDPGCITEDRGGTDS